MKLLCLVCPISRVIVLNNEIQFWTSFTVKSSIQKNEKLVRRSSPTKGAPKQSATSSVGVISKVLKILEALQSSSAGLSLKTICEMTDINKSTAHRFLRHLGREGYLIRTEAGAYLIGPRFAQISARASMSATLQAVAKPALSDLWNATQETVNLGVLDQGTVLYLDVIESSHEFRLASHIGTRRSLHATALGKTLAAFAPASAREAVLSGIVFQPATPKTIRNLVQLREELEKIRRQGHAVDNEEAVLGARCVSAPILNNDSVAVAAVSISGPITRISSGHVPALAQAVKVAANAISSAMGFSGAQREAGSARISERVASANT
jgi:DNA-binding IclR family transcriptional regulator